jgi:acyl-CoA synthetase (AMP-forming)/AMP-acid ligase II
MPPETILGCLGRHAECSPDKVAFSDGVRVLTYGELTRRSRDRAGHLLRAGRQNRTVMLAFPAGLEFVVAFFACLFARAVAIPVPLPFSGAGGARVRSVVADARTEYGWTSLAERDAIQRWSRRMALGVCWEAYEESGCGGVDAEPGAQDVAFVQYTSGSISTPRGLAVTHGNLMDSMERLVAAFDTCAQDIGVCWLPHYHDMGLVGTILHTVHRGAMSVLLPPSSFLREPLSWLRMLDTHRATITSAPSFAFRFCAERTGAEDLVGLDLSFLRAVIVGAEPVLPSTIEAFEATFMRAGASLRAFRPSYGLAEATLIVSGRALGPYPTVLANRESPALQIVGCGCPLLDTTIVAVNGATILPDGEVGEICIRGPSVIQRRWGPSGPLDSGGEDWIKLDGMPWRRTGDDGFISRGELFVVGRRASLLKVGGRSLHAEDVEATALRSHPSLLGGTAIALAMDAKDCEHVALIVETARPHSAEEAEGAGSQVTLAVAAEHGLRLARVLIVQPRSLPRTTSGKLRRSDCKAMLGELT